MYVKTNMRRKAKWVLCEGCKPGRFRQQKRVWQQRSTYIIRNLGYFDAVSSSFLNQRSNPWLRAICFVHTSGWGSQLSAQPETPHRFQRRIGRSANFRLLDLSSHHGHVGIHAKTTFFFASAFWLCIFSCLQINGERCLDAFL